MNIFDAERIMDTMEDLGYAGMSETTIAMYYMLTSSGALYGEYDDEVQQIVLFISQIKSGKTKEEALDIVNLSKVFI